MKSIVRGTYWGMMINLLVLALYAVASDTTPRKNLHITLQNDGVIFFGENYLGISTLKHFSTWDDFVAYTGASQLNLPQLCTACQGTNSKVFLDVRQDGSFRVMWGNHLDNVMHAPDLESAAVFVNYIKYSHLEASPWGYSLPLL